MPLGGEGDDAPPATMVFGKVVKNKAYFKRYQVKYRRRREGKTDYRQRLKLVRQDKNKYSSPKYRFCVRFTNKDIVCQIIYATIAGDKTVCAAYSHELPKYGLKVGLTNYAAAYCTGLLCARRALQKFGLDEIYEGCTEPDGEDFHVEEVDGEKRPFRCLLDVGLRATNRGGRVWGALKGACDGGLDIPHNEKRYPGYDPDDKTLDAEDHARYIFGQNVAEYMALLEEDDPEMLKKHFASYLKEGLSSDDLEDLYAEVHEKIREDPSFTPTEKKKPAEPKKWQKIRLTYDERKAALKERLAAIAEMAE
eukprot:PRCOL_00004612-RA